MPISRGIALLDEPFDNTGLELKIVGLGEVGEPSWPARPVMNPSLKVVPNCIDPEDDYADCMEVTKVI